MLGSRRAPQDRPRVFKGKVDDEAQLRRAMWRVGLVIVALLGVVALSYWLTFSTTSTTYTIKDKRFKIPAVCMEAVETGRNLARTNQITEDLQALQSRRMPRDKLTFVALTTLEDTGRFLLLMASLRKFLGEAKNIKEMVLVVPDNQVFAFRSIASFALKMPVEIIGEEKLSYSAQIRNCEEASMFTELPDRCTKCFSGYSNQMLLKLLAARYVDTEFYLTLDADTLLRTPFQLDRVLSNGQATYNLQSYAQGSNWFDSSASALQLDNSPCMTRARTDDPDSLSFGVTPAILSRTLALKTVERLVTLYGGEFEVLMHALNVHGGFNSDNFWTEYTLYTIVGCHEKLFPSFHRKLENGIYAEDVSAVWLKVQASYWNASLAFDKQAIKSDAAPFTVFQSRIGTPVNEIAAHIQPFLQVSE